MVKGSIDWRRVGLLIGGWFFLVLGVVGLFLPILQGGLFLFIGIGMLSLASPRVRLLRMRLGRRYPKLRQGEEKVRGWMKRWRERFARRRNRDDGPAASAK